MNVTQYAIENRSFFGIALMLFILLGAYSFASLPTQLIPDRESLSITVRTAWRSSSPSEIESHIIEPQERAMRGLAGLKQFSSNAFNNVGFINLEFEPGIDLQNAFVEVLNRLNQMDDLPPDAAAPEVIAGAYYDVNSVLSTYFVRTLPSNEKPIEHFVDYIFEVLIPILETVPAYPSSHEYTVARAIDHVQPDCLYL